MSVLALVPVEAGTNPFRGVYGQPLLRHAVNALRAHVDSVRVLAPPGQWRDCHAALEPVAGAWLTIAEHGWGSGEPDLVLVHDPLRAFTPATVIAGVMDAIIAGAAAAVPVRPVTDTIKVVASGGGLESTRDRDGLRTVQSPTGFAVGRVTTARGNIPAMDTFPAELMHAVDGDPLGLRIETSFDVAVLEALLQQAPVC